jgi:HTH-type transcriptional regulator/antitoxin HipB
MSPMKDTPIRSAEHLGMAIRLKRQEKKLSQAALAELLGVERKWVLRLEAGNARAELGLVLKAFKTLGLRASLSDEAGAPDATQPPRPSASRLNAVFRRLERPARK